MVDISDSIWADIPIKTEYKWFTSTNRKSVFLKAFLYIEKTFFYVLPVAFYFPKGNIKLTSEKTDSGSLEFPRLFLLVVVQYHSIIGP